jgi:hypothetical protein
MDPMKHLVSSYAAIGICLWLSARATGQAIDPAELLPARTLAYVELSDPARCADELRGLFKGSFLEDPIRLKAVWPASIRGTEAAVFAMFMGPEAMDELADWQAINVGLTGFTPRGYPEAVGVLTGKSRLASLGLRTLITAVNDVRCLRLPDGIEIYEIGEPVRKGTRSVARTRVRYSALRFARALSPTADRMLRARAMRALLLAALDAPTADDLPLPKREVIPPPRDTLPDAVPAPKAGGALPAPKGGGSDEEQQELQEPEFGFYCALRPGCIVWGTTPDVVAETLRRMKGKGREASLARSPLYREACATRRRPDLFLWADAAALTRHIDDFLDRARLEKLAEVRKQNKAQRDATPTMKEKEDHAAELPHQLEEADRAFRRENAAWFTFRAAANPTGMRYLTGSWTIHEGNWTWRVEGRMRPGQSSPFLGLLRNQPLSEDLLRGLPRDSYLMLALPLGDGEKAWDRVLHLGDLCSTAMGERITLSRAMEVMEIHMRLRIGREVAARVRAVGYALRFGPGKAEDTSAEEHIGPGVLIVEAVDEAAAGQLHVLLPRLLVGDRKPPASRAVRIAGQTVHSLCGEDETTVGPMPAFWGRRDRLLILGWRRRDVAAALADWRKPLELSDHPGALAALRDAGAVRAAALFSGRQTLATMARIMSGLPEQTPKQIRSIQYMREMGAPMALMPPTLLTLRSSPDRFCAELTQPEMRTASQTVIDVGLAWLLDLKNGD